MLKVECSDGSLHEGCEICDADVLLSDDPASRDSATYRGA